jgi:hypothetical protein
MSPDIACGPTGTADLNDNRRKWTETLVSRARRQLGEVNGRLSLRIVAEQGKHCSRVARVLLTFCEKAKFSRFPSEANHENGNVDLVGVGGSSPRPYGCRPRRSEPLL